MAKKSIKETKYCSLLSQSVVADEEYSYAIERIVVKKKKREEIRFAVYKEVSGKERILVRPLDLQEELLIDLFRKSLNQKIFSKQFVKEVKQIFQET